MTEELATCIREAAEVLESFGAKEVYLFGSAASDEMREDSDIDMAVCGLAPEVFFTAWAKAVREFPGREMDLINLDKGDAFSKFLIENGDLHLVVQGAGGTGQVCPKVQEDTQCLSRD
jgi:predicted nucleotidyltransferase